LGVRAERTRRDSESVSYMMHDVLLDAA